MAVIRARWRWFSGVSTTSRRRAKVWRRRSGCSACVRFVMRSIAHEVEVIPLEELQRPRMDVVMTVSGIFRDLFAPTMTLLDKAVRRVAALDEPA